MSLGNPFCVAFGKKLEANRILNGFGTLNNFAPSGEPDANFGVGGTPFPYDGYGLRPHISLIFLFSQPATIKKIVASCFRAQIGSAGGAEVTGQKRLFCRIVGFRGLGQMAGILPRTIFDPMQWSKEDAVIKSNPAAMQGIDYEVAGAWEGAPVGRFYRWISSSAELFYDNMITKDDDFSWDVSLSVAENDVLLMTPAYQDRNFYDTTAALPNNVFGYAGSPAAGGTDYRNFPVLRTITVSGENC